MVLRIFRRGAGREGEMEMPEFGNGVKRLCGEWVLLISGSIIYAISAVWILNVNIVPGSMLGIAVAAHKVWGIQPGVLNLLLNVPIMLAVTRKMGLKVLIYTVFIMTTTSVLIDSWSIYAGAFQTQGPYVIAAISGVVMGVACAFLILAGGTMAGTTALTLLITGHCSCLSYGTILFCLDSCIILTGSLVIGDWGVVPCSLMFDFVCAKTMDVVMWFYHRLTQRLHPAGTD